MLTGRDCIGTQVVALRHQGGLTRKAKTLPEILRPHGYKSLCVGFTGNPAGRGFDEYLDYEQSWGDWGARPLRKAEELNTVAIPAIKKLAKGKDPWMVMLRHMDPHSPYLPPEPYSRMFYDGDECRKGNKSMDKCRAFAPFWSYFESWMPPGITDIDWAIAQYEGAVAYMDACIRNIFTTLETLGILDDTIVVLNGDHGETLDEHECWFDHHGLYEPNLIVPLIIRYPRALPTGARIPGFNQHKDLVPTLLELAGIKSRIKFDGQSLLKLVDGEETSFDSEIYITECTWMRKHGWRTPEWKLIQALEPDFHFMPKVELYNLLKDPLELTDVAKTNPDIVKTLTQRMNKHIKQREKETGLKNPMLTQGDWHGKKGVGAFKTSRQAYQSLGIGDAGAAKRLQAKSRK
jgi:arylsulfatase A-like enzyme